MIFRGRDLMYISDGKDIEHLQRSTTIGLISNLSFSIEYVAGCGGSLPEVTIWSRNLASLVQSCINITAKDRYVQFGFPLIPSMLTKSEKNS